MPNYSQNPVKTKSRGEFTGSIIKQHKINHDFYRMGLEFAEPARECLASAKAGQFVALEVSKPNDSHRFGSMLRRPFSIAGLNNKNESPDSGKSPIIQLEIIYQVIGPGTKSLMQRKPGDKISIIGPLGNGFIPPGATTQKIVLIGGGVGLPPLYFWADQLMRAGYENIVGFAGARSRDLFAGELIEENYQADKPLLPQKNLKEFARSNTDSILTTDDGGFGFHGSVLEALEKYITSNPDWKNAIIYACGPYGMLKAVAAWAQKYPIPCQVCMEAYMACGIGVCQSCVVPVRDTDSTNKNEQNYKLVCSDGPVFPAEQIVWR